MRKLRIWAAVGLAFFITACGEGAQLDQLTPGETGKVVEVQSGDVLKLDNGLVVRLAGVETPYLDEAGGPEARTDLVRLVQGRQIELFYGGARRDPYDRALAQARLARSGRWIEGTLLRDGWARVRTFADNRALAVAMYEDEAKARVAKRGLWAMPEYDVRLPDEMRNLRGFQIVEGRVLSFTETRSGAYLDFTPGRNGFAVALTHDAERDLASVGAAPSALVGRLIRVRGMVGWDGAMRIDHPEPIERLKEK
ncbi:MAG TPA: thermonuclease family protein [Caulobacteraceae bacterium]|nr:thermonuclease family protein [Caulobacteraceae bacterium]